MAGAAGAASLEDHARALDQILDRVDRFYDATGEPPLVRPGDVLAAEFSMYTALGDFRMAVGALERMASHGLAPENYVGRAEIDEAFEGAGVSPPEARRVLGGAGGGGGGVEADAAFHDELPYDGVADEVMEDELPDRYSPEPSYAGGSF